MTNKTTAAQSKSAPGEDLLPLMGIWSAIALMILLVTVTIMAKVPYGDLVISNLKFTSGNLSAVPDGSSETLLSMLTHIAAIVLMTIPLSIVAGMVFSPGTKSYNMEALDKLLDKGPRAVFAIILLEELFTRGLFLGLLTRVFTGPLGFYAMFILGNTIWALVHLLNFKDKEERNVLQVLPQFIGGITFTYVFARYGFWAAVFTHFLYNMVLMSLRKEKVPTETTGANFIYYFIVGIILGIVMYARGIGVSDLLPWLNNNLTVLEGYTFWDYAVVLSFVECLVLCLANILLLDPSDSKSTLIKDIPTMNGIKFVFVMFLIGASPAGLILFQNWVLSHFVEDFFWRALIITMIMGMLASTRSGSALARLVVVGFPRWYFIVVAFSLLGFGTAFWLSIVSFALKFLPNYMEE